MNTNETPHPCWVSLLATPELQRRYTKEELEAMRNPRLGVLTVTYCTCMAAGAADA